MGGLRAVPMPFPGPGWGRHASRGGGMLLPPMPDPRVDPRPFYRVRTIPVHAHARRPALPLAYYRLTSSRPVITEDYSRLIPEHNPMTLW